MAQRGLAAADWGDMGPIRVRMALHTAVTEERGDDYVGPALNRLARVLVAGHGGQILLTEAACVLARPALPAGVEFRDLGEHRLKDLHAPRARVPGDRLDLPAAFRGCAPSTTARTRTAPAQFRRAAAPAAQGGLADARRPGGEESRPQRAHH